jgi:hypothetical protein
VSAGKLFYHIISTEAHRALQEGDMTRYQQLANGMRVTLTALADRFQALNQARLDAIKTKVRARQLRQRQQQQQQQSMLGLGVPQPAAAAAATGVAADQLRMLQPNALPSLLSPAQHDAGCASALPLCGSISPLLLQPQLGVHTAADADAVTAASAAAGSSGVLPLGLAGSSVSSNSGSRLAGHKRQHSSSSSNGSRWSDDVLWILHRYCLFHTSWSSPRAPPYNGLLLEQVAAELFGPDFRVRSAA